jgi:hypothetical protein
MTTQADSSQETMLLTIFLKHDQSKTLDKITEELGETGFWAKFPPEGAEVVSWYVMMGIGQVVTLRFPPSLLTQVNLAIERYGWGAFRTEFYSTFDYRDIWRKKREDALGAGTA